MSYEVGGESDPAAVGQDERRLIERVQSGDRPAFDALVLRHQQQIFAVAMRMLGDRDEAQDVAQDVFVRAYCGIGGFRREAKVSTWLVSITINLCRNRRRWWARRRHLIAASLDDPDSTGEGTLGEAIPDPGPTPARSAEQHEQQRQLLASLQMLNQKDRTVIVLRDIQGHSYEEIAEILGCRLGTVKSRLNRARLQLRALLDGKLS